MFKVKRAINGISLNGDDYLLKDDNSLWEFESKEQAKRICLQLGIELDEIEIVEINNV